MKIIQFFLVIVTFFMFVKSGIDHNNQDDHYECDECLVNGIQFLKGKDLDDFGRIKHEHDEDN